MQSSIKIHFTETRTEATDAFTKGNQKISQSFVLRNGVASEQILEKNSLKILQQISALQNSGKK
jgi:hypothetical protein